MQRRSSAIEETICNAVQASFAVPFQVIRRRLVSFSGWELHSGDGKALRCCLGVVLPPFHRRFGVVGDTDRKAEAENSALFVKVTRERDLIYM